MFSGSGADILNGIDEVLDGFNEINPKQLSPLVLAYIGDAVFEIIARTFTVSKGNAPVNVLHRKTSAIVKAKSQSDIYFKIEGILTEEEHSVFKKGRNAKSYTSPKNADITDYRHATGLEALFGYLFLEKRMNRAVELFKIGMDIEGE